MPYAVAHMLIPMILVDIFRDKIFKIKRKVLPNKYILIAGLAGLFPDIDIPIALVFKGALVHRTLTHSIWIPLTILAFSSAFYFFKNKKLSLIFFMIFIGTSIHILIDSLTSPTVALLYPLSSRLFGITLVPESQTAFLYIAIDAVLLFFWFFRMSFRKNIQDIV